MRISLLMAAMVAIVSHAETDQSYPPLIPKDATPHVAPTPAQKNERWAPVAF
jgi:hypothetical protein